MRRSTTWNGESTGKGEIHGKVPETCGENTGDVEKIQREVRWEVHVEDLVWAWEDYGLCT